MLNPKGYSILSKLSATDCHTACKLMAKYNLRQYKYATTDGRSKSILNIKFPTPGLDHLVDAGFLQRHPADKRKVRISRELLAVPPTDEDEVEDASTEEASYLPLDRSRSAVGLARFIPIILLEHAAAALAFDISDLRKMFKRRNLPIYSDPEVGAVVTVKDFYALIEKDHPAYKHHRFDRQMFFQIMANLHSGEWCDPSRPMGYDQRLELELSRVAKLPSTERALRAMEIYESFRDALGIVTEVPAAEISSRITRKMKAMMHNREAKYVRKSKYKTGSKRTHSSSWRDMRFGNATPARQPLPETSTPQQYPPPPQEQDGQSESPRP